jgi:hypothetical protein
MKTDYNYYRNKLIVLLDSGNHWDIQKAKDIVSKSKNDVLTEEYENLLEMLLEGIERKMY